MKKQILLSSLLLSLSLTSYSFAAEPQVITLKDGSQVKGELVGVADGVYTVHTAALGDVKVNASEVNSISNGSIPPLAIQSAPVAAAAPAENLNDKIQTAQSALMSDPAMMQQVQAMAQDPELMKLLSDPALVQAVTSRNTEAIKNNPKAQELMNNPKMKALMDQLGSKVSTTQ